MMETKIMETSWYEFSTLMREVYVGDETDLQIGSKQEEPQEMHSLGLGRGVRTAEARAQAPTEVIQLPTFDLERIPVDELRRMADAISPQARPAA
ncbi:MAG: hypothetical protein WD004_05295 [Actinomycetota bacterium]